MNKADLIRLFEQVLELPTKEREEFLGRVASDDAALGAKLRGMFAMEADTRGILDLSLEQVAADAGLYTKPPAEKDESGRRIGVYRLAERLASGGMGVVYRAERNDGAFSQVVALKLTRSGNVRSDAKERFLRERQILAHMKHPHIAQIFDGGLTEDGEPWFAMEYVDGEPLLKWCNSRRLDLAERIRLLLSICDAVSFAHTRLVIHRDIKPSNVLVDSNGSPKLLDFGIAKLLYDGPEDRTDTQGQLLTPDYASPEQIRNEVITTATDVHALGLLLYELVCGKRAFGSTARTSFDVQREVLDVEAPSMDAAALTGDVTQAAMQRQLSPGAFRQALRGDLQYIVAKALRKHPDERYRSVALLREDLQNYLEEQPIAARLGVRSYRLRKFMRRNRIVVAMTCIIALTAMAGLLATFFQYRHALREARTSEAVSRLFASTLGSATLSGLGSTTFSSPALLEKTERELRELLLNEQPELYARGLANLARSYATIGNYRHAEFLVGEAKRLLDEEHDSDGFIAATQLSLLNTQAHYAQAAQLATSWIARLEGRDDEQAQRSRIAFETELVLAQWGMGQPDTAMITLNMALGEARVLAAKKEELVAQLLIYRCDLLRQLLRFAEAEADIKQAIALAELHNPILADDGRERLLGLSLLHQNPGVALAEQLLENRRRTLGDQHPKTGRAWIRLGYLEFLTGKRAIAQDNLAKGLSLIEASYGTEHPEYAEALIFASTVQAKDARDNAQVLRNALQIYERTLGPQHELTLGARGMLAARLQDLPANLRQPQDHEEAAALFEQNLQYKRNAGLPAPWEKLYLAYSLITFGSTLQLPKAEALLLESKEDARQYFGAADRYPLLTRLFWARLRFRQEHTDQTDQGFAQLINENLGATNIAGYLVVHHALLYRALYAFEICRVAQANDLLMQAVSWDERVFGRDAFQTRDARGFLDSLHTKGRMLNVTGTLVIPQADVDLANQSAGLCKTQR